MNNYVNPHTHTASACTRRWPVIRFALLVSLLLLVAPTASHAATLIWDGSSSGNWGTGANWDTGTVPQDGDDLVFPASVARLATTNNTSTTRRYRSITITGANYALRGNSLTLSNGITATYGAGSSATVELDLTLARSQEIECTTDNAILYVTGDLALGAFTLTVNGSGNVLLGGVISGTGGVTKNGSGSARLYGSSANTYTGTTRVNTGTLELNKTSANAMAGDLIVGNNTGTDTVRWLQCCQLPTSTDVTVNDGAVLDLHNFDEALGGLTLIGGEVQTGTGLLTLGGNVTAQPGAALTNYASISGRLSLGSGTRTFNVVGSSSSYDILRIYASISGSGGFIKTGAGSLGLYSSNSFSGPTTLSEGWLSLVHSQALGSTASGTTVSSTSYGLLMAESCQVGAETLTLDGPCFWSIGGWPGESHSWGGDVIMTGQSRFYVKADVSMAITGRISGTGGFTKTGGGGLQLVGTTANAYQGTTRVDEGTLFLSTVGEAISDGELIIGNEVTRDPATVFVRSPNQIGPIPVTINSSAELYADDYVSDTIGALTLNGGIVTLTWGTLTLGGNLTVLNNTNRAASISGGALGLTTIRTFDIANTRFSPDLDLHVNVTGAGGFIKTGAGRLDLRDQNTFLGTATIDQGYVFLYHPEALGSTAGGTVVNGSAYLGLPVAIQVGAEPLTLNSTGPGGVGALYSMFTSNSWAGDITLARHTTITVLNGGILNLSGAIGGAGGFTLNEAGTLILSGSSANSFAGDTRVTQGTLLLDKAVTDGALPGPGALIVGESLGASGDDVVRDLRNYQIGSAVDITVNISGLLDLDDHLDAVGRLNLYSGRIETGTGLLTLGGDVYATSATNRAASINGHLAVGSGTRTFNVVSGNWSPDLRVTAQMSGSANLLVTAPINGGLMLLASNDLTGTITAASHTMLWVSHPWALGQTSAGTIISNWARIGFTGDIHVEAEPLTMDSASGAGAFWVSDGSNSWAGPITLAQQTKASFASNTVLNLAAPITGPGGLTVSGSGTLVLSGPTGNTYTGDTVVERGQLFLGKNAGTGVAIRYGSLTIGDGVGGADADVVRFLANNQLWSTVPITMASSGLLDLNGYSDTVGALTFTGGRATSGTGGRLYLASSVTSTNGSGTIQGEVEMASTRTFNTAEASGASLHLQAHVRGSGGLIKIGPGQLYLSSSNSYEGLTTLNEGRAYADDDFALGATVGGTMVNPGAALVLRYDTHVGVEPLTLNGTGQANLGALASIYGSNSWAGPITLGSGSRLTTFQADDYLHLSGAIGGSGGATLEGAGTIISSGSEANTYAGATYVNGGTLVLNKSATDGAVPGNLIIGNGEGGAEADVVRLERANQIANSADVTVSSSGRFDLNDHYDRINAVTGSGSIALGSGHLIAGHSGSSFTFDGLVSGAGYLWKVGAGAWTLTANNTYLGTTRIEAGALLVNGSQAASDVQIWSQSTLGGTGTVGRITSTGGVLSPGLSPGTLTSSNVLLDSASDVLVELTSPGADQLNARGKVALANAHLVLSAPGLLPTEGQQFVIVNNDDTDAVTGTFAGLSQGALVTAGPRQFRITYTGGNGNDVVLIATNTVALRPALSIWRTATNSVAVSWPQSDIAWQLHATTNLGAAPVSWTELPPPYISNATKCLIMEPATAGERYYRLHNP